MSRSLLAKIRIERAKKNGADGFFPKWNRETDEIEAHKCEYQNVSHPLSGKHFRCWLCGVFPSQVKDKKGRKSKSKPLIKQEDGSTVQPMQSLFR